MNILALDSTTEACSVALLSGQSVFEKFEIIGRGHAEHLLPMMNSLLQENNASLAEIDLFAYSAGPGSFTGIRIGAAMMQGLALARGCQLAAVSSLAALARSQRGLVLSVIDARMDQVYHAMYRVADTGHPEQLTEAAVSSPGSIELPEKAKITVVGTGWDRYQDEFAQMASAQRIITGVESQFPHAADIAMLAKYQLESNNVADPEDALPYYIRDKVALKMVER